MAILPFRIDTSAATIVDSDLSAPIPLESGVIVQPGRIRVDVVRTATGNVIDACFITRDETLILASGASFTDAAGTRTYTFNWGIETALGECILRMTEIIPGNDAAGGSRSEGSSEDHEVTIGD